MVKNSNLVYSTDSAKQQCPNCGQFVCQCRPVEDKPLSGQTAKIKIDRKNRKGKSVTIVEGLHVNPKHLADIAQKIKQKIGTGGTTKQGRIEIQGEHRDKVAALLTEMGVKTTFSGG